MPSRSQARERIRVLLVDCTKMECQLLADAIRQDKKIHLVAAVTTATEAFQVVTQVSSDIVLLSERLDGRPTGGYELARQLQIIKPELRVVMLLDSINGTSVVESFRSHASGVFSRDGSVESLRKCVYAVFDGQTWASTEALRFVLGALSGSSMPTIDPDKMALLTRRERDVVGLAADGVKNREIAQRLGLSEHTVKNYLFSIFGKLGVSSRLELTLALKREWNHKANAAVKHPSVDRRDVILDWLRALAEGGLGSAQLLLAQMYSEGRGVSHDPTQAYRLFLLAEKSAQIVEISRSARKKLAGEMSPMQIAEAERQAATWLEEKRKTERPFPAQSDQTFDVARGRPGTG
jgi:two-component system nitrate/nitrite response regulator NarL